MRKSASSPLLSSLALQIPRWKWADIALNGINICRFITLWEYIDSWRKMLFAIHSHLTVTILNYSKRNFSGQQQFNFVECARSNPAGCERRFLRNNWEVWKAPSGRLDIVQFQLARCTCSSYMVAFTYTTLLWSIYIFTHSSYCIRLCSRYKRISTATKCAVNVEIKTF